MAKEEQKPPVYGLYVNIPEVCQKAVALVAKEKECTVHAVVEDLIRQGLASYVERCMPAPVSDFTKPPQVKDNPKDVTTSSK